MYNCPELIIQRTVFQDKCKIFPKILPPFSSFGHPKYSNIAVIGTCFLLEIVILQVEVAIF